MGGTGDPRGPAHQVDFVVVLDEAHFVEHGTHVVQRGGCALAGARLLAHGIQGRADARIPRGIVAE